MDQEDAQSAQYKAISDVKTELEAAAEMIECRLDMIEKADSSKVGWSAAPYYEKSNGSKKKENSDKLWSDAEKAVQEAKKTDRTPFRARPAAAGKTSYSTARKGTEWVKLVF